MCRAARGSPPRPPWRSRCAWPCSASPAPSFDRRELARLCSRVENEWLGAHTGLLDQLASLYGEADTALRIDFSNLDIQPVPLVLADGWRLVTLDSGDPRALAASGYNERRAECARACELLGVESLREAQERSLDHAATRARPPREARARGKRPRARNRRGPARAERSRR